MTLYNYNIPCKPYSFHAVVHIVPRSSLHCPLSLNGLSSNESAREQNQDQGVDVQTSLKFAFSH